MHPIKGFLSDASTLVRLCRSTEGLVHHESVTLGEKKENNIPIVSDADKMLKFRRATVNYEAVT